MPILNICFISYLRNKNLLAKITNTVPWCTLQDMLHWDAMSCTARSCCKSLTIQERPASTQPNSQGRASNLKSFPVQRETGRNKKKQYGVRRTTPQASIHLCMKRITKITVAYRSFVHQGIRVRVWAGRKYQNTRSRSVLKTPTLQTFHLRRGVIISIFLRRGICGGPPQTKEKYRRNKSYGGMMKSRRLRLRIDALNFL